MFYSSPPSFKVVADKGFFYSKFDNAFICQKKNHFQVTVQTSLEMMPAYCKLNNGNETTFHEIKEFQLQLYGVKEESHLQAIQVKQSSSDRKPLDYKPVECRFRHPGEMIIQTHMRLHFAQTTQNNNRKRSKFGILPNPDQRYFMLIVEIMAISKSGKKFPLCAVASERVIVRVCELIFLQ